MIGWAFCPLEKAFILICCVMYCSFYDVSGSAAMIPRPGSSHQIISQPLCHCKEIVSPDSCSASSAVNWGWGKIFSSTVNAKSIFVQWLVRLDSSVTFKIQFSSKQSPLNLLLLILYKCTEFEARPIIFVVWSFIAGYYIWLSYPTVRS